jgi:REP element-mobilizing transposase RayT
MHAYVLMTNHHHLLLETAEANLSRRMRWLQNACARRINTEHRLWGHVVGGRYKSIVVEPGNCFWALMAGVLVSSAKSVPTAGMQGR